MPRNQEEAEVEIKGMAWLMLIDTIITAAIVIFVCLV